MKTITLLITLKTSKYNELTVLVCRRTDTIVDMTEGFNIRKQMGWRESLKTISVAS